MKKSYFRISIALVAFFATLAVTNGLPIFAAEYNVTHPARVDVMAMPSIISDTLSHRAAGVGSFNNTVLSFNNNK